MLKQLPEHTESSGNTMGHHPFMKILMDYTCRTLSPSIQNGTFGIGPKIQASHTCLQLVILTSNRTLSLDFPCLGQWHSPYYTTFTFLGSLIG